MLFIKFISCSYHDLQTIIEIWCFLYYFY